ncbi:hypothetical protein RHGRI_015721 [Rhododendron griersonianum]|uniref:C3H1-type domain-containing protein n=1 Tax=Rhododendron griersonianum TaxID=479676 RepID=A0AAV6JS65_9ERIC|nr:hypothetical protein RHGRI_015721 [Rhododendron griersonianum]
MPNAKWRSTWLPSSAPRKTALTALLLQDRRLLPRRSLLSPSQLPHHFPHTPPLQHVPPPRHDHPKRRRPSTPATSRTTSRTSTRTFSKNSTTTATSRPSTSTFSSRGKIRPPLLCRLSKAASTPVALSLLISPRLTDFREATCRQYEENNCNRGGHYNFMHVKMIARDLRRKLYGRYRGYKGSRSRSRSVSLGYRRDYDRRDRDRDHGDYRGSGRRSGDRHGRYDSDGGGGGGGGRRRHNSLRLSRSPGREGSEERRARIE